MEADREERTKEALIRAAEQLMAARGINVVDLKEIQIAAGQKNRSVVNYYFGDRAGLITAIMTKHRLAVNAERHRMLDRIEHQGQPSVERLVEAIVLPLAASLGTPSGRDYIIILAESAWQLGTAGLVDPQYAYTDSVQRVTPC